MVLEQFTIDADITWNQVDKTIPVIEKKACGECINTSLGWIDKRTVEREPVCRVLCIARACRTDMDCYKENGSYTAGNVITVEEVCSLFGSGRQMVGSL